ncbi:MAG TPA: PLP-dependent aminotransferase family protein [Pyrinomonadaceae bacterium]|nr:PLP-dependent aminotransferase family protein [Pyrinomonadaceae bacterium]
MKKQQTEFPFVSLSDRAASGVPMHRQIYEKMRQAILSGELPAKSRVPASRTLAAQLGVSRMTVVNAYDQLFAEGYLESKIGAGTFVAGELPEDLLQAPKISAVKTAVFSRELNLSRQGAQLTRNLDGILREHSANKFVPFQNGLTAIDAFPFDTWARIAARWNRHAPPTILLEGDLAGFYPLREAIAAHLKSARGVNCEPGQVIITAGSQQALALISAVFLEPEDEVWIEDPGYTSARSLFALSRAKLIPVPVDKDGLDFKASFEQSKTPKLIYVTPSHQYPLGVTMSITRRLALIETARATGAWIIEDDYDSEYRYAGHPLASLQGLDQNGRVLYVGTFSKTIFPSLKLGCLVVPPDLVDVFTAARMLSGAHSPFIEQAILAEFIAEGHFARHLRRMRTLYEERQKILIDEVRRNLKGLLEINPDDAGMHLVGWLPDNFDDREVSEKAAAENIRLSPISDHFINKNERSGLVFGYAAFDEKQIRSGITKLTKVLTEMARSQNSSIQRNPFVAAGSGDLSFATVCSRSGF